MTTLVRCWPLLLPVLSAPAAAQSIPTDYDPHAYCIALGARTGGRSAADINSCMADEAHAQASLTAALWNRASATIRERCLKRNARRSYDLLAICVDTELERSR